jgi:Alpha-L-fucosidase
MLYERIPLQQYGQIAKDFKPIAFNADTWVRAAKGAGMKYIVITAKHHDGFAMFDSPSSGYNIVQQTPWQKDPMRDLADACKRYNLKLCFYYSLGRDWADPDVPTNWPSKAGRSNSWDYPNEDAKDLAKYIERKVKPQLGELLTQYGPIGIIWFDTPELFTKEQSKEIQKFITDLQPNCLINSRIGNHLGDYDVIEQSLMNKAEGKWEACITMSGNWGYNRHDTVWKSSEILVRNLVEVVSKGGNLLLNIGPKGDGTFPVESITRLKSIGGWMSHNAEAIYGTRAWKVHGEGNLLWEEEKAIAEKQTIKDAENDATSQTVVPDIRFTTKDGFVYVFVRSPKNDFAVVKKSRFG